MADNWELSLIAIVDRELAQLERLIDCERNGRDDIERGDIHSQLSRLNALTDLSLPEGLLLSETSAARLSQQNLRVMELARSLATNR